MITWILLNVEQQDKRRLSSQQPTSQAICHRLYGTCQLQSKKERTATCCRTMITRRWVIVNGVVLSDERLADTYEQSKEYKHGTNVWQIGP